MPKRGPGFVEVHKNTKRRFTDARSGSDSLDRSSKLSSGPYPDSVARERALKITVEDEAKGA